MHPDLCHMGGVGDGVPVRAGAVHRPRLSGGVAAWAATSLTAGRRKGEGAEPLCAEKLAEKGF